jgi:site-specific recombinase XerD
MRHSTAVALLKSGADLSTIGQFLPGGHPNSSTYGHLKIPHPAACQ